MVFFSPHLCVGFLFLVLHSRLPPSLPPPATHTLSTHNFSTHNFSTHNLSPHNLSPHNLSPHNLSTHNLSPHNLSTNNLSPHNSHTTCTHTHNLLTHNTTQLAHAQLADHTQIVTTQLTHTQLAHKQLAHTQLAHAHTTYSQLARTRTQLAHFACRRGTYGTGLALVALLVPVWRRGRRRCLRGRRGTYGTGLALVARFVPVWRRGRRCCLRGRRGTWRLRPSLCEAGVALGDIDRHFAWQAWHLWHWAGSGGALGSRLAPWTPRLFAWQAWHLATSTVTLRGRRGTWRHRSSLCVAGVALLALGWLWWRAWFPFGAVDAAAVCVAGVALATSTVTLRGRRGFWRHRPSLCVAGVALGDIDLHFAWPVWHLWHWTGSGGTQNSSTQLCHRFISHTHTTLSQIHFTHNFVTHNPFTHNFVTHNSFTHNSFTHNFVTYISFTHKLLHTPLVHTQTYTHTQHCHTHLFHPTCLAPSPFLPAFPISFSHLLGDHWKKLICGVIRSFNLVISWEMIVIRWDVTVI